MSCNSLSIGLEVDASVEDDGNTQLWIKLNSTWREGGVRAVYVWWWGGVSVSECVAAVEMCGA